MYAEAKYWDCCTTCVVSQAADHTVRQLFVNWRGHYAHPSTVFITLRLTVTQQQVRQNAVHG